MYTCENPYFIDVLSIFANLLLKHGISFPREGDNMLHAYENCIQMYIYVDTQNALKKVHTKK